MSIINYGFYYFNFLCCIFQATQEADLNRKKQTKTGSLFFVAFVQQQLI